MKHIIFILIAVTLVFLGCAGKSTITTTMPDGRIITEEITNDAMFYKVQMKQMKKK